MIMRNINTDLIDAMKIYLPKGNNLANALMDILYLAKKLLTGGCGVKYRSLLPKLPPYLNTWASLLIK